MKRQTSVALLCTAVARQRRLRLLRCSCKKVTIKKARKKCAFFSSFFLWFAFPPQKSSVWSTKRRCMKFKKRKDDEQDNVTVGSSRQQRDGIRASPVRKKMMRRTPFCVIKKLLKPARLLPEVHVRHSSNYTENGRNRRLRNDQRISRVPYCFYKNCYRSGFLFRGKRK